MTGAVLSFAPQARVQRGKGTYPSWTGHVNTLGMRSSVRNSASRRQCGVDAFPVNGESTQLRSRLPYAGFFFEEWSHCRMVDECAAVRKSIRNFTFRFAVTVVKE